MSFPKIVQHCIVFRYIVINNSLPGFHSFLDSVRYTLSIFILSSVFGVSVYSTSKQTKLISSHTIYILKI